MIRSAHGSFGSLRAVHGSSVAPASVSFANFFSSSVNSACSAGASSPRNASPITTPSRATTAPTFGETFPGSLSHRRARAIARSINALSAGWRALDAITVEPLRRGSGGGRCVRLRARQIGDPPQPQRTARAGLRPQPRLTDPLGTLAQPLAYSSADRDSNSNPTKRSSPMTHASWPGSITYASPGPISTSVPSSCLMPSLPA